ncbi:MAG: hypothetical protein GY849_19860, partial [Deltaproteobacteria bacterium]|nr:hypothetical protein [Deltaproteobacteria bacterium]
MKRKTGKILLVALICLSFSAIYSQADEWGVITIPTGKPIKIGMGTMLTG